MKAGAVWTRGLKRPVAAFARSRGGGAMLIGGSLAMLVMSSVGALMSNYGWREAQREEIDAALRASVSASAHFMRGDLSVAEEQIRERVANFMRGLLSDITIDKDNVVVKHDFSTNRTTISVQGNASFRFTDLWGSSGTEGQASLQGERVIVVFDATQFEFALAIDISRSMGVRPQGWTVSKLDALKASVRTIRQTVSAVSATNPGIVTLSLAPFSNVVNVADTSGMSRTTAKERYVRMLTGAHYNTKTSRDTEDHWVDTFHSYGTGDDMGPLAVRSLPDFREAADWNLRKPGTEDVSGQSPAVGTWNFEGKDFWNGCVMARWGAYWDPTARPDGWDASDTGNWPASKTVAGWEPGADSLANLPLHLSDAPPDASDPNSRFTAYSWPDARIGGFADGLLNDVLYKTLDPDYDPTIAGRHLLPTSDNHWHLRATDGGGSLFCAEAPIVPLTDDATALGAVDQYRVVDPHSSVGGQTFLHLGIVWGLRTLSPLWRDVWQTKSASDDALPRTPCLDGGSTQGCSQFVEKSIVIVSDGAAYFGRVRRGRSFGHFDPAGAVSSNPDFLYPNCSAYFWNSSHAGYRAAVSAEDATAFAGGFDVDANGVFTPTGTSAVLDGFQALHPDLSARDPAIPSDKVVIDAHRAIWENALEDMTPWQLFRGYDANSPTAGTDAADVLTNPANLFGLRGRPARNGHFCRLTSPFSAYGRADDLVRVGDSPPVNGAAPFSIAATQGQRNRHMRDRISDWFLEACAIAGRRGVRIHAIYIGGNTRPWERAAIELLEECVDRGYGGNAFRDEVHITPTEQELKSTVERIIDIRRTLRFVDA
ncbi:MAG: hypothetical protein OXH52_10475 [Gammaproteobacteria bacterium]|nr:hypothetical protein [Gammaproteobacteria bacterium]